MLASSCRRKILRILLVKDQINIMELVRKANSTYNQVNSNLKLLEKEGIIVDKRFNHKRIIKLNRKNSKITYMSKILGLFSKSNY